MARRRAAELSLDYLVELLLKNKLLTDDQKRLVYAREPMQRLRLARELGVGARKRELSPIELVASYEFPDTRRRPELIDEDKLAQLIAVDLGMPYRRIDRLKIDANLVTRTVSRPFARRHNFIPLERDPQGAIVVAVGNPFDDDLLDSLRELTRGEISRVVSAPADVHRAISEVYGFRQSIRDATEQLGSTRSATLENLINVGSQDHLEAGSAPVVSAVEYLLHYAFDQRASDVHIEPRREETIVRMRIDGILHGVYRVPRTIHDALANRVKVMARLDISSRKPQDGRIRIARSDKIGRAHV